ncbi:hypothetical protein L208DRAFT_1391018 [Tricholoma matsutake]|nr:hypothetical protein L208DRAFT_1391018 [Tricholoma matsutake 945]
MRFMDLDRRSLIPEVQWELRMVTVLGSTLIRDYEVMAVVPLTRMVEGGELLQWNVWSMQNH